jgi:carbon storage regulator
VGERVLVLRRRAGEAITIGGDVEVEIMEISRTRVKLGVRAPRTISVLRRETIQVAADNREASEFIERHGVDSIDHLLNLLRKSSPESVEPDAF